MKPTTPEQFAACYGTFIADLNFTKNYVPAVMPWFRTQLPDVYNAYTLNASVFNAYPATIDSFPRIQRIPLEKEARQAFEIDRKYDKQITLVWTAITIDLKSALSCAEVDSNTIAKILASFQKLRPQTSLK